MAHPAPRVPFGNPNAASNSLVPSQTDLANTVLSASPELRARVIRMLDLLLDDMERVIRIGHRPHITALQKMIVPVLLKSISGEQADTQGKQIEAAMERMYAMMRRGTPIDTTGTDVTGDEG